MGQYKIEACTNMLNFKGTVDGWLGSRKIERLYNRYSEGRLLDKL